MTEFLGREFFDDLTILLYKANNNSYLEKMNIYLNVSKQKNDVKFLFYTTVFETI